MATTLLGAAVRGGVLVIVVWVLLKALRLRDPVVEKRTWTLVVAAALVMPLLTSVAGVVAPPLGMIPLKMLSSVPIASTAALAGTVSGLPGPRLTLIGEIIYP